MYYIDSYIIPFQPVPSSFSLLVRLSFRSLLFFSAVFQLLRSTSFSSTCFSSAMVPLFSFIARQSLVSPSLAFRSFSCLVQRSALDFSFATRSDLCCSFRFACSSPHLSVVWLSLLFSAFLPVLFLAHLPTPLHSSAWSFLFFLLLPFLFSHFPHSAPSSDLRLCHLLLLCHVLFIFFSANIFHVKAVLSLQHQDIAYSGFSFGLAQLNAPAQTRTRRFRRMTRNR